MTKNTDFRLPFNDLTNYVPQNLRNPVISSLIDNLFNRFMTHDESVPLYGYVGRKPASPDDRSPRVPQPSVERDINSIVPVLNFKLGPDRYAFTIEDLIAKAEAIGISPGSLSWMYSQGNNYLPPIDLDKFTNFFNYYWVAKALPAVPSLSWNPTLAPEYYTIAAPLPADLNKLNVVAASTKNTVLTGTGFGKLSFRITFTSPTAFTITPIGTLGAYTPIASSFNLTTNNDHFAYRVQQGTDVKTLLEFDITRDEVFDQFGNSIGLSGFETGDEFYIDVQFLTRNYTLTFNGAPGVKGKLTHIKTLNEYQIIDNVRVSAGDRVLIKSNSVTEDGIYIVSAGEWKRAPDFDGETRVAGARVFDKNRNTMYVSIVGGGGLGFKVEGTAGEAVSNTNQWQEGNYWVSGEKLADMGLARSDVVQAVRPIIEYAGDLQLNSYVKNGVPSDSGSSYKQIKTEFNQLPMFDLFRYDGSHSGLVSSVFYYEEDLTAELDLKLQKRVKKSTNDSADFIFNHGMADADGQLLFVKRSGKLKTIWHAGYYEPTIVDVTYGGAGNGTLDGLKAIGFAQQQVWTMVAETPTTFTISGSKMPVLPSPYNKVTVGTLYKNGELEFTIQPGNIAFTPGDSFVIRVANMESPRYVYRDENDGIYDRLGGPAMDPNGEGAWQIPRTFYNNPYNDSRSPAPEGSLYSHFRGILTNQVEGQPIDYAFGGSIKLWSEQQTLLASLLMQRDMTPVSVIDLAQRQYETALNTVKDIYNQQKAKFGPVKTYDDLVKLFDLIQSIRAKDNDVRSVLYDSTSPLVGFPATLPQLGLAELVQPTLDFDTVLGRMVLVHHDGHKSLVETDDTLNSLMLLVETRLYEGINPNARKYDFTQLKNDPEYQDQLKKELFAFAAMNGLDPLGSDYVATDPFTWNYSKATGLPAAMPEKIPGRWHELLKSHQAMIQGVIPTERPNLEPWKLMGYPTYDAWWATVPAEKRAAYVGTKFDNSWVSAGAVKAVDTTPGITPLFGLQTIDGVQLVAGDRVLLTNETAPENNGIWVAAASGWQRAMGLPAKYLVTVTAGTQRGGVWGNTGTNTFAQSRSWSNLLWSDIQAARPGLRLSVNTVTDELLPPYVNANAQSAQNALTNIVPQGTSLGYSFGDMSPIETVWSRSLEYGYARARALFRYDPLAFLGFCWGFNWVEVDGILYDGFDMSMPGHKRFRLHGDLIAPVARTPMTVTGSGTAVVTYNAYDKNRKQNFTVTRDGKVLGYATVGTQAVIGGLTFTIKDEGHPFRIGDRFEITDTSAIFVPTTTYKYLGFGQVFTHALRETSIDTESSFAVSAFRDWEVNMGYRAGGLVATDDLQVYTNEETLSTSAYDLLFKKNHIARNEWVQALRISTIDMGQKVQMETGFAPFARGEDWVFRIEGYNPRYTSITYYDMDLAGNPIDFHALGKAHSQREWYHPTHIKGTVTTDLPLTITGVQNVVNFLFGYSKYLESRGWEFNQDWEYKTDAETGRTRNFQLEIEKFIDRCYAGIELGQGHVVNPFIDRAWFNQDTGLLSEFIDTSLFDVTGHPGVFDVVGMKFHKDDLDVVRTNAQSSFGAAAPMFSAHIQIDDFEHVFIFNNYSQPSTGSGLLYDPFSGARVVTYKFNGRKQATNTMRPEFGGHFLVGNEVHQNLQASTDNIANLYDANHAFENELTTRHALALLGFNRKEYFDDLDISERTQFNFWRGLIQAKGTNLSIDAYLNNNRFDDAKIDEYWAYKLAEYGDARPRVYPELKLSVNDALTQFTRLQFDAKVPEPDFTQVDVFDEERWFSIDDMNQAVHFEAADAGTFTIDAEVGKVYKLPFVADELVPGQFTKINATTIKSTTDGVLTVLGKGPARPRFNPVKLFNYVDNELVAEIPVWHPAAGIHTPGAMEGINIISDLNPAKYNYSKQVVNNNTYDPLRAWGKNEVGRVWFDTRNLAYVPYYDATIFPNLDERLSRWGTLADYATVDVYEWTQSSVPPSEFDALAQKQAGDAALDPQTKAAGQVAQKQTYSRERRWGVRPIAWSYSSVPTDVDWEATPPMAGGSTNANLTLASGLAILDRGTFAGYGITAGMHLGAWNNDPANPKPLSEYLIEDRFLKLIMGENGGQFSQANVNDYTITIDLLAHTEYAGQFDFSAVTVLTEGELPTITMTHIDTDTADTELVTADDINFDAGQYTIMFPAFGIRVNVASKGIRPSTDMLAAIVQGLADHITLLDAATVTPIVPSADVDLSNDVVLQTKIAGKTGATFTATSTIVPGTITVFVDDKVTTAYTINGNTLTVPAPVNAKVDFVVHQDLEETQNSRYGWRVWNVPTQAELNRDAEPPFSSWKPYVGDFTEPTTVGLAMIQEAVEYAKAPLTLRNGEVIERFQTTWTEWSVLQNVVLSATAEVTGPVTFTHDVAMEPSRVSVYVNGIAQLKAAFTINGKVLTVNSVPAGSEATVIIRKYEPTIKELAFDPDVAEDLTFQKQYQQDYEYVAVPVRDREGALTTTLYYFWVKNKTTPAVGKKQSVQAIAQELREGPENFLTFQNISDSAPYFYDAITISGLSYIVTKDNTFKLRFTRNFTLRDDPEELNLKNVHTEWALMRFGQKSRIPETLWNKLVDSVVGIDQAGNTVPAIRRVLYDERNGTRTQFGFGPEQTLAPSELLKSSIAHTILNTRLINESSPTGAPDYITFLDLDESDKWFEDAVASRKTMTDIWNQASVAQVNEIFFAALDDILASNYELSDIFKTSRISAYSIKVVTGSPIAPTFE